MTDRPFTLDADERRLVAVLLTRLAERSACWRSLVDELEPREVQIMANVTQRLVARLERYDRTPRLPLMT